MHVAWRARVRDRNMPRERLFPLRLVPKMPVDGYALLSADRLAVVTDSRFTRAEAIRDTLAVVGGIVERRRLTEGATPAVVEMEARLRMLELGTGSVASADQLSSELQQVFGGAMG